MDSPRPRFAPAARDLLNVVFFQRQALCILTKVSTQYMPSCTSMGNRCVLLFVIIDLEIRVTVVIVNTMSLPFDDNITGQLNYQ